MTDLAMIYRENESGLWEVFRGQQMVAILGSEKEAREYILCREQSENRRVEAERARIEERNLIIEKCAQAAGPGWALLKMFAILTTY